jgi:DNA-binding NarL/FixJ family response regulator
MKQGFTTETNERPTDVALRILLLTERERDVAQLAGEGLRNQEIAARLGVSVVTVRHQMRAVFKKLQVADRHALAQFVQRYGLAVQGADGLAEPQREPANATQGMVGFCC